MNPEEELPFVSILAYTNENLCRSKSSFHPVLEVKLAPVITWKKTA